MSDILTRIKDHFAADRPKTLKVAEWGPPGFPLIITYYPVSISDLTRLRGDVPNAPAGVEAPFARAAWLLVQKACDVTGKPMFADIGDLSILTQNADPNVVLRISAQMLDGLDQSAQEP